MSLTTGLRQTQKTYDRCARKVKLNLTSPALPADIEVLVGIGIAADWLGWASELETVNFSGHRKKSDRLESLIELSRFTYLWTAANALFSRPSIQALLGAAAPLKTELDCFKQLCTVAQIPAATETAQLKLLHTILDIPMAVHEFPWMTTVPKLFEVVYYKYTTAAQQKLGFGKKLAAASTAGSVNSIDLPTIIYATRNWHVHGVLLSSSFRGPRKKFELYINAVNKALAAILDGASKHLQSRI